MLKQFQLPEPSHYVLHVVSFLVGAGAQSVSVTTTRKGLKFAAPGVEMSEAAIRSPFSVLLNSESPAHLSELALGLNTLLGGPDGKAQLTFDGLSARYSQNSIDIQEVQGGQPFLLETEPYLEGRKTKRELELIRRHFRYSPVLIEIDGVKLDQPPSFEVGLEIHLKNDLHPVRLGGRPESRLVKETRAPLGASLRIGRGPSVLRVIALGREYVCSPGWEYFLPDWRVDIVLNCANLKKDLSQQSILQDERFQNLTSSLRIQVEQATELLLSQFPPLEGTGELVDDLIEELFLRGEPYKALEVQENLTRALQTHPDVLWRSRSFYRLALMRLKLDGDTSQLSFALNSLQNARSPDPLEPNWSIVKAQMAFKPGSPTLRGDVRAMVLRGEATPWMKERCYRWLSAQPGEDVRDKVWYRVEMARQAFQTGRKREALRLVERVMSGPDGEVLHRTPEYAIDAYRLYAEIAVDGGHLEKAVEVLGSLLALLRNQYGQYSLRLGLTLEQLAYLLQRLGQKKEAREYRAWSQRLHE